MTDTTQFKVGHYYKLLTKPDFSCGPVNTWPTWIPQMGDLVGEPQQCVEDRYGWEDDHPFWVGFPATVGSYPWAWDRSWDWVECQESGQPPKEGQLYYGTGHGMDMPANTLAKNLEHAKTLGHPQSGGWDQNPTVSCYGGNVHPPEAKHLRFYVDDKLVTEPAKVHSGSTWELRWVPADPAETLFEPPHWAGEDGSTTFSNHFIATLEIALKEHESGQHPIHDPALLDCLNRELANRNTTPQEPTTMPPVTPAAPTVAHTLKVGDLVRQKTQAGYDATPKLAGVPMIASLGRKAVRVTELSYGGTLYVEGHHTFHSSRFEAFVGFEAGDWVKPKKTPPEAYMGRGVWPLVTDWPKKIKRLEDSHSRDEKLVRFSGCAWAGYEGRFELAEEPTIIATKARAGFRVGDVVVAKFGPHMGTASYFDHPNRVTWVSGDGHWFSARTMGDDRDHQTEREQSNYELTTGDDQTIMDTPLADSRDELDELETTQAALAAKTEEAEELGAAQVKWRGLAIDRGNALYAERRNRLAAENKAVDLDRALTEKNRQVMVLEAAKKILVATGDSYEMSAEVQRAHIRSLEGQIVTAATPQPGDIVWNKLTGRKGVWATDKHPDQFGRVAVYYGADRRFRPVQVRGCQTTYTDQVYPTLLTLTPPPRRQWARPLFVHALLCTAASAGTITGLLYGGLM